MSVNFTGITFANQKVSPSDDAIVRRAILPDGILTGCDLSYSGSTLTMAAGQLMVCGRQIRHPAAHNWAIVDATSGYARLLLTIDLTRTSTKDAFEQVVDTIEYASAVDGFPELEQTDINGYGSRYQVAVCVVSLGTGGISGIVSKLEKSAVDGSGGLNFRLVGGTTQPADPKENTIWVKTDNPITKWILNASPNSSPTDDGAVNIVYKSTNAYSDRQGSPVLCLYNGKLSGLPGEIWIELTGCYQSDGSDLKPVDAFIYISGSWVRFSSRIVYLYNAGSTSLSWKGTGTDTSTELVMTTSHGLFGQSYQSYGGKGTVQSITVPGGCTKLCMKYSVSVTEGDFSNLTKTAFGLRSAPYSGYESNLNNFVAYASLEKGSDVTVAVPIAPELIGLNYYVGLRASSGGSNVTVASTWKIKQIWFE